MIDFINDPIGTKYGCKYVFTNGTIGTFGPLTKGGNDGRKIKDPLNIFGSYFKPIWPDGKKYDKQMVAITSILTLKTKRIFRTESSILKNGTEDVTKEEIDFDNYKSVGGLDCTDQIVLSAIPKDQLFITKDLLGVSEFSTGINKITIKCTNLKCKVALSLDNTHWVAWSKDSNKWVSVDLNADYESLKSTMNDYTDINSITQEQYDTYFSKPKYIGIALLCYIEDTDTSKKYTVDSIVLDYVGDDDDKTPSIQYFNFIKAGYTHQGNPILMADRTIQQGIAYKTLAGAHYTDGTLDAPFRIGQYPMYMNLPSSAVQSGEDDEWKNIIVKAPKEVTGNKEPFDFYNTSIASITATIGEYKDSFNVKPGGCIIGRGGERIANFINIGVDATSADYGWRPKVIVDVTSRKSNQSYPAAVLPEVDNTTDLVKGKCISCDYIYSSTGIGEFRNLGRATLAPLSDYQNKQDGSFYFVCVGYTADNRKICIADRPVCTGMNYKQLANNPSFTSAEGMEIKLDYSTYHIRLPFAHSTIENEANEYDAMVNNSIDTSLTTEQIFHNDKTITLTNTMSAEKDFYNVVRANDSKRRILPNDTFECSELAFRPVLLINPQVSVDYIMIMPYVGYEVQTDAKEYKCDIKVTDANNNPMEYKLIDSASGNELSPLSKDTTRNISVEKVTENTVTNIDIVVQVSDGNGGTENQVIQSFSVFRDKLYRTSTVRTFGDHYDGYEASGVDYHRSSAIPLSLVKKNAKVTNDGKASFIEVSNFTSKVIF